MAFKPPTANPTRECLPLVIQLMPYYAQYNELTILRELHSKLDDPKKQLHQRMLTEAIVREQWAMKVPFGGPLPKMDGTSRGQTTTTNNLLLRQQPSTSQPAGGNFFAVPINNRGGEEPMEVEGESARKGRPAGGMAEMAIRGKGGRGRGENSRSSSRRRQEDEDVVIVDEEGREGGGGNHGAAAMGFGEARMAKPLNEQMMSNNDPLAKRRSDFLREASTLYNNKYRMLSRSVYEFYIKRLKITQNLDPRLLLKKDLEIRNKFELAIFAENGVAMERLVERGKENRKLVAIEEVFDVVHVFHERIGHGKRMAIYDAIKREYANITLNCVLLYMAGCQGCYSTGGDPAQMENRRMANGQCLDEARAPRHTPPAKTVESRAAKLGLDEIDYSEHFIIGEDEIRCRHCHFVYFHKSRQRPRHSLRSHLRNYHRKLFNQMMELSGQPADKFIGED